MSIQTVEQQRAAFALSKVQAVRPADKEEFKSRANEMPAMIHMNGLGQTCAFYLSKGGVHKQLYQLLSDWICDKQKIYNPNDLLTGITQNDMHTYRIAQAEAQALLLWVKKFANVYCGDQIKAEEAK